MRTAKCCFWSLNFALSVSDWIDSGGFHEGYYGYGGEDTDFGRTLEERGIPINWMQGAKVYHQYHDHCMPPIHHLHSVLRNADVFAARWGHRTMGHWLHAFRLMGLIEQDGDQIRVLRQPSQADFAMCHQSEDMPYANSRRVIDQLQNSAATGAERAREVAQDEADLTVIAAE